MFALISYAPAPPPPLRSPTQSWSCRGWKRRRSQGRRHLRGDDISTSLPSSTLPPSMCACFFFFIFCDMGVSCRSWQAESVDSGCSNSTAFTAPCSEGLCAEGVCITTGGHCDQTASKLRTVKVERTVPHVDPPVSLRCRCNEFPLLHRWRRPP